MMMMMMIVWPKSDIHTWMMDPWISISTAILVLTGARQPK